MKRFILFAGLTYYPIGPDDFAGDFDTYEEAMHLAEQQTIGGRSRSKNDWWVIWDIVNKTKQSNELAGWHPI